uniref:Uncharacterized protein n=1 Tax=Oncorhynchus tshawytscha TaxID=74940 RepID=A0A8C8CR11_ONCTS
MPELPKVLAMLLVMFISLIPSAEAFDGGDAVALLLGVIISVVGVCACIAKVCSVRSAFTVLIANTVKTSA